MCRDVMISEQKWQTRVSARKTVDCEVEMRRPLQHGKAKWQPFGLFSLSCQALSHACLPVRSEHAQHRRLAEALVQYGSDVQGFIVSVCLNGVRRRNTGWVGRRLR